MLSFKALNEKKTKVKINPSQKDLTEKDQHGEDCTCIKCEQRREKNEANDGPTCESVDLTEEWINASVEVSADYFFEEGINEDGLDQIINEVGLEDFVNFVIDPIEELNEERSARKASVKAPSYEKVKAAVNKSDAAKKKAGKGEYSKSYAKRSGETEDSTDYKEKAPAKKKAKPVAKATVRKPAVKSKKKAETVAKVEKAVKTAKKTQPAKPTSKKGLLGKVGDAVKKGVERHNKARAKGKEPEKRVKEFAKGFKKGVSGTLKFAGKVKKAVSEEVVEEQTTTSETKLLTFNELNRYGKETGKATGSLNKREGSPVKKGGNRKDLALIAVRNMIRRETGKPEGQQKKEKGKKPPKAGEYGARRSPKQIVQNRRAQKKAADAAMRDTRGT